KPPCSLSLWASAHGRGLQTPLQLSTLYAFAYGRGTSPPLITLKTKLRLNLQPPCGHDNLFSVRGGEEIDGDAVGGGHDVGREHGAGGAVCHDGSVAQGDDAVGEAADQREVVHGDDDALPFRGEVAQQVHDVELVGGV